MQYVIPVLLFAGLALLAGVLLSVFSKVFAVEQDERIPLVRDALPGANCGACGYAGCDAYAEAVVKSGAKLTACVPGGTATAKKIGEAMGVDAGPVAVMKAVVRCNGVCGAVTDKYDYQGAASCAASNMFYSGKKTCTAGCLGLGDCLARAVEVVCSSHFNAKETIKMCKMGCIGCRKCERTCPSDAIHVIDNHAVVDHEKCTACGACVEACPRKCIVKLS